MSIAIVICRAQLGLFAPLVHVEVSLSTGLPAFGIVGLPATVVKESKDRVRAAIVNSNFTFPSGHITVNLSPGGHSQARRPFRSTDRIGDTAGVRPAAT